MELQPERSPRDERLHPHVGLGHDPRVRRRAEHVEVPLEPRALRDQVRLPGSHGQPPDLGLVRAVVLGAEHAGEHWPPKHRPRTGTSSSTARRMSVASRSRTAWCRRTPRTRSRATRRGRTRSGRRRGPRGRSGTSRPRRRARRAIPLRGRRRGVFFLQDQRAKASVVGGHDAPLLPRTPRARNRAPWRRCPPRRRTATPSRRGPPRAS